MEIAPRSYQIICLSGSKPMIFAALLTGDSAPMRANCRLLTAARSGENPLAWSLL